MGSTTPATGDADVPLTQGVRPLYTLRSGDVALIYGVKTELPVGKRLADLGFISGARIEMIRPGRPCIVRINGTRVGVGRAYQERVLVDQLIAD